MRLNLPKQYSLRDAVSQDAGSLFAIHRAAIQDYVEQIWGWDDAWQEQHFHRGFDSPANRQVICDSDVPIGFLCFDSSPRLISIESIELHPDYQGRGIGTSILNQLIA